MAVEALRGDVGAA